MGLLNFLEFGFGNVDLLLTDLVMPEGRIGREPAEQLRARKPGLQIIYTSGYSADVMGGEVNLGNVRFLQKPYPPVAPRQNGPRKPRRRSLSLLDQQG